MDDFWVGLIGFFSATTPLWSALIGATAAIFGGRQLHKLDAEKQRRRQLADDIAGFLEACSAAFAPIAKGEPAGPYKAKAAVMSARIVLSLPKRDSDIQAITATMVNELDKPEARLRLTAVQNALQDWYRGTLQAKNARDRCASEFKELLAKYTPNTR